MITRLDLSHMLETAFLPLKCHCSFHDDALSVQLINLRSGNMDLEVRDIDVQALTSSRAIAELVAQIKEQYKQQHIALPERRRYAR